MWSLLHSTSGLSISVKVVSPRDLWLVNPPNAGGASSTPLFATHFGGFGAYSVFSPFGMWGEWPSGFCSCDCGDLSGDVACVVL